MLDKKRMNDFNNEIAIKFQLYNSLFLSLPFSKIEKTGILLSLLLSHCEEGFAKGQYVDTIIDDFIKSHTTFTTEKEIIDFLFKSVQYVERQVVLFDALEDAAYIKINDMEGVGTLKDLENQLSLSSFPTSNLQEINNFCVRLVLTAHPTQFYSGSVLGIINDLTEALKNNDTSQINLLLQQLGKTPFLNEHKPTPFDEAVSLIWYLENVFYPSIASIIEKYGGTMDWIDPNNNIIVKMGFWPGGDRDGNPFVLSDTTWRVAQALNIALLKCYYRDIRKLKRRITFKKADQLISKLEQFVYDRVYGAEPVSSGDVDTMITSLQSIVTILVSEHNGLFVSLAERLIGVMKYFGLTFAFIDIRQENEVHTNAVQCALSALGCYEEYRNLHEEAKIAFLCTLNETVKASDFSDTLVQDTFNSVVAIQKIQDNFGENACHRYIISQCSSALNIIEVLGIARLSGWKDSSISIDIVPLFETVDDLQNASIIMQTLYQNEYYKSHLKSRGNKQTIMVGFSDGTKDGGYLMANWMIYKAKESLTTIAKKFGIEVLFFDGRGGPPARGGGKTNKFYASLGPKIANKEIQLTIQGQTISSNFGNIAAASYNMEQLITAGISNVVNSSKFESFNQKEEELIMALAKISLQKYLDLKNHPSFVDYMSEVTPLAYFGKTNIGSRPAKRGKSDKLTIKDLRAIPFVASWNMVKQNVPGFYGLGTALHELKDQGQWHVIRSIYQKSLFIRTLLDNSEMTLLKTFFPVTKHIENHPTYGAVRALIVDEYNLTTQLLLELGNQTKLMENYPIDRMSIKMRERIVLPIVTIQQYALKKLNTINADDQFRESYEMLIMRCAFGIINAGRNSA